MGLNPSVVGNTYTDDTPFHVNGHDSIFYALATLETNPVFFDPRHNGAVQVPPMFACRYAHGPIAKILRDPAVGIRYDSIVHFAQRFEWLAEVHPGDVIHNHAAICRADNFENGGLLGIAVSSKNDKGEEVTRSWWDFFDRSAKNPDAGRPPRGASPTFKETLFEQTVSVPSFQTFVYAEASGDHNGIHVDDTVAKKAGLPGIILHGFMTMALVQRVVVDHLTGPDRDPSRLKTLSLKFSKPVFPGEPLNLKGYVIHNDHTSRHVGITATNADDNHVIREAEAVIVNAR